MNKNHIHQYCTDSNAKNMYDWGGADLPRNEKCLIIKYFME